MIQNSKFNERGFTLLEILVAISLLSLVITITVGIFVAGSKSQRKIIELSVVQREGGYLMETISRELRMATSINADQEDNQDSNITFTNYEGASITYDLVLDATNGNYITRGGSRISSSDVMIEELKFYTSEVFNNQTQPLITIVMKIKAKNADTNIQLQNSIVLRIY